MCVCVCEFLWQCLCVSSCQKPSLKLCKLKKEKKTLIQDMMRPKAVIAGCFCVFSVDVCVLVQAPAHTRLVFFFCFFFHEWSWILQSSCRNLTDTDRRCQVEGQLECVRFLLSPSGNSCTKLSYRGEAGQNVYRWLWRDREDDNVFKLLLIINDWSFGFQTVSWFCRFCRVCRSVVSNLVCFYSHSVSVWLTYYFEMLPDYL